MANTKTQLHDVVPVSMQIACAQCVLSNLCFPAGLPAEFQSLFPLVDEKRIRLARGEFLSLLGPSIGLLKGQVEVFYRLGPVEQKV